MQLHLHRLLSAAALLLAVVVAPAGAVTLYDASLGSVPSAQGWILGSTTGGTPGSEAVGGGVYTLNTTAASEAYGNARISPVTLNTVAGFDLSFRLRIDAEAHTSNNRSGYSVLFVGSDPTKAIEFAFWQDRLWLYDYSPTDPDRFVHGGEMSVDPGTEHTYLVAVRNQNASVSIDGNSPQFFFSLRDYTAAGGPYTVPNFLFFGDDSSRGTSITRLSFITVTPVPVPEPAPAALLAAGLAALALRGRAAAAWRQRGTWRGLPWPSIAT